MSLVVVLCVARFPCDTTFAFTDISQRNLDMVRQLCQRDLDHNQVSIRIAATTDRREALKDAEAKIAAAGRGDKAALKAGKHIFCEKPFVLTAAEAKKLAYRDLYKEIGEVTACPLCGLGHTTRDAAVVEGVSPALGRRRGRGGVGRHRVSPAGLQHPREITALHIVRRTSDTDVKLLANLLPFVKPGALLEAAAGRAEWPHRVFQLYWPRSRAESFQPLP